MTGESFRFTRKKNVYEFFISYFLFKKHNNKIKEPEIFFLLTHSGTEQTSRLHQTGQTCPLIWIPSLYFNLERSRCWPVPSSFRLVFFFFLFFFFVIPAVVVVMFVKSCHQSDLEMAFNWVLLYCSTRKWGATSRPILFFLEAQTY